MSMLLGHVLMWRLWRATGSAHAWTGWGRRDGGPRSSIG